MWIGRASKTLPMGFDSSLVCQLGLKMKEVKLTYRTTVPCKYCSQKGWVYAYHNEIKECTWCSKTGTVIANKAVKYSDLRSQVLRQEGYRAAETLDIIHLYTKWQNV
jgi:hypothetical protein